MSNDDSNQKFVGSVQSDIKESVQHMDASTLSSIKQIRSHALTGKSVKKHGWMFSAAGALTTACLVLVIYSLEETVPDEQNPVQQQMEMVSSINNTDLYKDLDIYEDLEYYQDLEFYEWLDSYTSTSNPPIKNNNGIPIIMLMGNVPSLT